MTHILRKLYLIPLLLLCAAFGASAQSLDEARTLAEDGNIDGAVEMLRAVVAAEPKNNEAALLLGQLLWDTGRDADAVAILKPASKRGMREATLQLAEIAFAQYDLDEARSLLDAYRASLRKGKRVLAEDASGNLEERIDKAEAMLDRVQNIEVIDSLEVDAEEFFRHYPLSSAAGRLYSPDAIPVAADAAQGQPIHVTESRSRMVWAAIDSAGVSRLMGSAALLGGEWEEPSPLGDDLGEGADAAFPYLMPDGVTLYYANDGPNTLGGYDIFQTRADEDGNFLQPANLGLPFNSPYNDYLLVIDEYTGAGWFATDRNRHPGSITIYTFIPQEMRVNVDVDNPALSSLARLDNISITQKPGKDYASLRRRIADEARLAAADAPVGSTPLFRLNIPGRGVYTTLDDFRSSQARQLMQTFLGQQQKLLGVEQRLAELRKAYGSGARSDAGLIRKLEDQLDAARRELTGLRNQVIQAEQ